MSDNDAVFIIDDEPEERSDLFGFDAYSQTFAELIANPENKTPLVIGIYGSWGSGKTSLMKTVITKLGEINKEPNNFKKDDQGKARFRRTKTIWFQPWKYGEQDEILAALLEEILKTMRKGDFFTACRADIEKLTQRLQPLKAFKKFVERFTKVDITELFEELPHRAKLGFYDAFADFFQRLIWTYLAWRPQMKNGEVYDDQKAALVIFIDDLDRCPQERVVKVLETVKLFMDWPGCVFMIGADNVMIENALKPRYMDDALKFMDKIVQVTFNLPQIPQIDFNGYLEKVSPDLKKLIEPHLETIIPALESNPRRVKRFLNNLSLQQGLLLNRGIDVKDQHLLYWNIIDYVYPQLRNELKDNVAILETIQSLAGQMESDPEKGRWVVSEELMQQHKVPRSLRPYFVDPKLMALLNAFDADRKQLEMLTTLVGAVESAEESKAKSDAESSFRSNITRDDMVKIPEGIFKYGDNRDEAIIKTPFAIDIYPVTNALYNEFISDDGYRQNELWGDDGMAWKKKERVQTPKYWNNDKYNRPEQPIVGVSFYEARAYARWAGKELPTDEQWERAARGVDGREYPWGDEFDTEKCNTKESGIGRTTRVTRYPNGTSPEGCYDMAGNVWEWTRTEYKSRQPLDRFDSEKANWSTGAGCPTLRGGSWYYDRNDARCALRHGNYPIDRDNVVGFRCVRTSK